MQPTLSKKRILVAAAFILFLIAAAGAISVLAPLFRINRTTYILVDEDDTPDSVRVRLCTTAHLRSALGFGALTTVMPYRVRTGRYAVNPHDNLLQVYRRLYRGQQSPINLTLPSVRTMDRLAAVLGGKLMLDSATWARSFADSAFCASWGYTTANLPCLFVPNTYQVYWNVTVEDFMKRMQQEHDVFWNESRRAQAEAAGLTPNEVATLASIVDEETAANREKPMVAGMYLNRLAKDMPLQADPTVKFALHDFSLRRIYHGHLLTPSPYNTYLNTGLPPGPIRIASIAGIDAVLQHAKHEFLYMCAKEDFSGTHNFARTYAEHLANAARYSAALNQRGIR